MNGKKHKDLVKNRTIRTKQPGVPVLSVIIPAYNLEKEIGRCLKSVLSQGIDDMEVIVVDDGSKDDTVGAVEKLKEKDRRINLIVQPRNRGVAAARNVALNAAKGEYIHFCDGDDAVPLGAYQEMLNIAMEEDADMVTGNYSRMYPNEKGAVRPFSNYTAPTGKEQCFESGNTMLWNRIYRRSVIEEHHIRFNESLKYYEDFLFFHSFLLAKPEISKTSMSVYIYTEPIVRGVAENIRYANMDCAIGLDTTWRTLFTKEISVDDENLWFQAYRWNLSWYFNYSWKMIQSPEIRRQTFEMLKNLVCWVEDNVSFCSWKPEPYAGEFRGIFLIDYASFSSIKYEDYLMLLACADNIQPRAAILPEEVATSLSRDKWDAQLAHSARKQIVELKEMFSKDNNSRRIWRDLYWDLVDSLVNDYWRPIVGKETKEELFNEIRESVNAFRMCNPTCYISNVDTLSRFKQIFCVDNAVLQAVDLSCYLTICATSNLNLAFTRPQSETSGSMPVVYTPEPIPAFINACASGQVGMRAIMRSVKAWYQYKTRSNKS